MAPSQNPPSAVDASTVFAFDDASAMRWALAQAREGMERGEVPVGAVVRDARTGEILAMAHNRPVALHDPCAHAEILALRAAAERVQDHRLPDCELFVTLEPCAMCAQAALHARVKRVVFGALEPKTGAGGSVVDLFAHRALNHQTQLVGGVLADEAVALMRAFFLSRRQQAKDSARPLRQDALRTPDAALAPWPVPAPLESLWWDQGPALAGLNLHAAAHWPEQQNPPLTWLVLHGPSQWAWTVYPWAQALAAAGEAVLAPDLIGFGRSDKPKKSDWHTPHRHADALVPCLLDWQREHPEARWVVLVPPALWPLWEALADRLGPACAGAIRFDPALDTPCKAALRAPYPDRGHMAGPQALALWGRGGADLSGSGSARSDKVWTAKGLCEPGQVHQLLPQWRDFFAFDRSGAGR